MVSVAIVARLWVRLGSASKFGSGLGSHFGQGESAVALTFLLDCPTAVDSLQPLQLTSKVALVACAHARPRPYDRTLQLKATASAEAQCCRPRHLRNDFGLNLTVALEITATLDLTHMLTRSLTLV